MKLACNYYAETEQLVRDGVIDIDYFKFPSLGYQMGIMEEHRAAEFELFMERITSLKPVLLHGLYPAPHDLCSPTLSREFDFNTVNRLLDATKTPGISLHTGLSVPDSALPIKALINTIVSNILFIKRHYAHLDFLRIENLDSLRYGELINPDIISEIINEAGCGFLLDVSHAYCASRQRGETFWDYIRRLPLYSVYEIHMNGWLEKNGDIMCHVNIHDEGYEILERILGCCEPKILTIEYGRHNDRIGAGVPVISPDVINERAKAEIAIQAERIRRLIG